MFDSKKDQDYIKRENQKIIVDVIKNNRPISRADIAKITDMSATTVGRIVSELIDCGFVKETSLTSSGVGRKAILLDIDVNTIINVGVNLTKYFYEIGIVDFDGKIIEYKRINLDTSKYQPDTVIEMISMSINKEIEQSSIEQINIKGICIGVPGMVDFNKGKVILSAQLGWQNIDVAYKVTKLTNINTIIDNSLKLKALAETIYGTAKSSGKIAVISIGDGVGSALIIDGELYRGSNNSAGEVGHTTVEPYGMLCECGKRGCLQTYIAKGALLKEANKFKNISNVNEIVKAFEARETWAINILEMAATYIGITINNIICMYNPDTVILSGELIEEQPKIIEIIESKLTFSIWEPFKDTFNIEYSKLRNEGIIIGAASLSIKINMNFNKC